MSDRLLFISDLHLQESRPDITEGLLRFLKREQGHCEALYILGDLFEVWLGDDCDETLADTVGAALTEFSKAGSSIYLMHGNRDFLLGDSYAHRCGATLLADPCVIQTSLGEVLISHGDSLCTDDVEYQAFRSQVRDPAWQQAFLDQPLAARKAFAEQARTESKEATANKAMAIMDVNQAAVSRFLEEHGQSRLLHGHTHRPARHSLSSGESASKPEDAWRLVLGDWDTQGWCAEITDGEIQLRNFALTE